MLILLFINDLPLFINEAYLDVYADDTTVHAAETDSKIVEKELKASSNGYIIWCLSNQSLWIFWKRLLCKSVHGKKVNRKVQEEPQAEVAANPWHPEEKKKWHRLTCA